VKKSTNPREKIKEILEIIWKNLLVILEQLVEIIKKKLFKNEKKSRNSWVNSW